MAGAGRKERGKGGWGRFLSERGRMTVPLPARRKTLPAIQQVDSPSPNERLLIVSMPSALRPLIDHTLNCQSQRLARRPWTSPGHLTVSDQVCFRAETLRTVSEPECAKRLINGRTGRASWCCWCCWCTCAPFFHPHIQHQYGV